MIGDRSEPEALPKFIAKQLPDGWRRYQVRVDDEIDMAVNELGPEDGDPVLMVHGNPTWGFLYRKVAALLATSGVRAIMPDLIGLGFSDKPVDGAAHTLDNHARWLGTLVDALELPPTILVVQDWGGPIGILGTANRNVEVAGVVLLNTAVAPPKEDFKPTLFHRVSRLPIVSDIIFRGWSLPQTLMSLAQGDKRSIGLSAIRAYRYPLGDKRVNVAPLALARMVPNNLEHPSVPGLERCRDFLTSYDGPIRAVWGDNDPVLGSIGRFVERLLPNVIMTHTEAGHFLQEEVPGDIAAAVQAIRDDDS